MKQAGKFSFLRIYESGHEVPYYQPVVALEMFERAICGKDIATGLQMVGAGYETEGTVKSEYREGNGTMQFEDIEVGATTYNTSTNEPNPFDDDDAGGMAKRGVESGRKRRARLFKPLKIGNVE